LQEVTISASRNDHNVRKAQVGSINVPMREIKNLPVLAGERDAILEQMERCIFPATTNLQKNQPP